MNISKILLKRQILLAPLEILFFVLGSLIFLTGLAAKYFKDGWESLTLLHPHTKIFGVGVYIHQIMLLLKDNLIKEIQNRDILQEVLRQLSIKDFLDPQALQFLNFLHSQKPISEIRVSLLN